MQPDTTLLFSSYRKKYIGQEEEDHLFFIRQCHKKSREESCGLFVILSGLITTL